MVFPDIFKLKQLNEFSIFFIFSITKLDWEIQAKMTPAQFPG